MGTHNLHFFQIYPFGKIIGLILMVYLLDIPNDPVPKLLDEMT